MLGVVVDEDRAVCDRIDVPANPFTLNAAACCARTAKAAKDRSPRAMISLSKGVYAGGE